MPAKVPPPQLEALQKAHRWLRARSGGEDYLTPEYYSQILKPYYFGGQSDLEILRRFVETRHFPKAAKALELGCGPGRATNVLRTTTALNRGVIDLVDLSEPMLRAAMEKYGNTSEVRYVRNDLLTYLEHTPDQYDLLVAMWSFSHAVHQAIYLRGEEAGFAFARLVIERMCREVLVKGGNGFIMHFDALSEEQKISLSIRRRRFRFFREGQQSPSHAILLAVFERLAAEGIVEFEVQHFSGDAIHYNSADEALETFFNFHMEAEFNNDAEIESLLDSVTEQLLPYACANGGFDIKPGCFIFSVKRLV